MKLYVGKIDCHNFVTMHSCTPSKNCMAMVYCYILLIDYGRQVYCWVMTEIVLQYIKYTNTYNNRSANKNVRFFLKYWRWLIWPAYSDRSRAIFYGPWPPRTLLWTTTKKNHIVSSISLAKRAKDCPKNWPWTVIVSRSNKPTPTFQEKSDIYIHRSV